MLTTSLTLLTACLALPEIAHAGFILGSQSNIAVYYGQNSLGKKGSQQRLSAYCSDSKFNIIPLAFMNGISTPITNFANAGDNCTVYSGTQLLNCPQLEQDIILCQNTYQKTIILSLGGATYSEGGFSSPTAAQTAAANVWDLFGPNNGAANRPFGSAVVDGFDFDFEASTQNAAPFAQKLRDLMDAAHNKKYYLTAAPQCPYPDLAQEEILLNVKLDFVMVQFYNNYCGALSFDTDVVTQDNFNMERWDTWARSTSKNDKVKILLGVPANTGAGAGYLSATELTPVINYCKQFSSFGGVMMWDMSQMVANVGFLDGVYAALSRAAASGSTIIQVGSSSSTTANSGSVVTSTTRRTTTTTTTRAPGASTSTSTSRLIASTNSPEQPSTLPGTSGICNCPLQTIVTVTATVFTTSAPTALTNTSTARTSTTPATSTTSSVSTRTTATSVSQASAAGTVAAVNQWQQCGGRGYTGPTQCRAPYKCVSASEWWADCR
ncbi:glycoside hydrolase superfamily [Truncatella angustata]|uniref:chitinase n=1 Tax=Truncatella angustata TaxID=152316 RepID=A0A9P8RLH3_9PEZI|nr:glycoside hydrolase superfamily [Truncatella angustata]KAH6646261.1 glycoside hydrolase superfamily [Truncatella angustata]